MSLAAFGDDGIDGATTSETLEEAGWSSNPEGTLWWKYKGEEMSFEEACQCHDDSILSFLEDQL